MEPWQPQPNAKWDLVPSDDRAYEFTQQRRRMRLRHLERVQRVCDLVRRHEYVVILGPAYSDKTLLMGDVNAFLATGDQFTPIFINLWRVRTDDEAAFFGSLAQTIVRSEAISAGLADPPKLTERVSDAASFRQFLDDLLQQHDRHIVLLLDHLQILPHDLTHRLLQLLRGAYMDRRPNALHSLDVVVAGSAVLAELSHDATSPFNMAHAVFQGPLSADASLELIKENLSSFDVPWSPHAPDRLLYWAGGDSYLLPLLVAQCQEKVQGYERRRITCTVVDQTVRAFLAEAHHAPPVRSAIEAIEADPDTMLDVVTLLRRPGLPRNLAHQQIFRTGVDRLQLSGAVCLEDDAYRIKHEIYRQVLRRHFAQGRVAHVLRMNGRWREAIDFLSTQAGDASAKPGAAKNGQSKLPGEADNGGRADLLEAIIQSIYAADREQQAYDALLAGIRLGFNLPDVRIYRAYAGQGELRLVGMAAKEPATEPAAEPAAEQGDGGASEPAAPQVLDLNDESLAEVRTLRGGIPALRGEVGSRRLLAPLIPERRAIGLAVIEHYSTELEPPGNPPYHGELLRFLRHASSAIENVVLRSAVQEIGRAVLDAGADSSGLKHVLQTVLNAVGGDASSLYLLDGEQALLERDEYAGDDAIVRAAAEAIIPLALPAHPAVTALQNRSFVPVRQGAPPELCAYLPLAAGGVQIGVLALFFTAARQGGFSQEDRKTLATFADQVAIAVYNQQLLSRTDRALQEQLRQVEAMRRRDEQMRSQELHDIINAVVHRASDAGGLNYRLDLLRQSVAPDDSVAHSTLKLVEVHLSRLRGLVAALEESANLTGVTFRPVELAGLVQKAVEELLPGDDHLTVATALEEGLVVDGNSDLLYDALRSILDNAREAMPEGGTISVRVSMEAAAQAAVRIRDRGQGISPAYQTRMFQPGFSTKPAREPDVGRGRGLFTCRAIVRKHGGDLLVDSQPGVGTEVTLLLPLLHG